MELFGGAASLNVVADAQRFRMQTADRFLKFAVERALMPKCACSSQQKAASRGLAQRCLAMCGNNNSAGPKGLNSCSVNFTSKTVAELWERAGTCRQAYFVSPLFCSWPVRSVQQILFHCRASDR